MTEQETAAGIGEFAIKPICNVNQLVDSVIAFEQECFHKYRHWGHSYYDSPQAKLRWEKASEMLKEVVAFAQTIAYQTQPDPSAESLEEG